MNFKHLDIPGVVLIEPEIHHDARGFFCETYHRRRFAEADIKVEFVQDNHSGSCRGVLRGLHYQLGPHAQGKLLRVVQGAVFDVGVDLRRGSPTFGRWVGENLNADNGHILYLPAGFAHGFCALQDHTQMVYKTTEYYHPELERGILWNDPELAIQWPDLGMEYIISPKDQSHPRLTDAEI